MDSKTEPALDEFITFKLLRLTNRFSRQSVRILARHSELRLPEWRCLAIVEAYGPQQVKLIASRLSADTGLISRSLASLEAAGQLKMVRNSRDRRQVTVSLTARGRRTVNHQMPILQRRQEHLLAVLSDRERRQFYSTIDKLHAAAEAFDDEFLAEAAV